jgi:hypothetical protein
MDVIKLADYIIDVVLKEEKAAEKSQGTPEEIAR